MEKNVIKINENVHNEIISLKEEKGVNLDEVVVETNRVRDMVLGELMRVPKTLNNEMNVPERHVEFTDTLFGDLIKFNVAMYYFTTQTYRQNIKKYLSLKKNALNKKTGTFFLTLTVIDDELITHEYVNSIQHEVHHYFETNKSGSTFNDKSLYDYSIDLMNGKDMNSSEEMNFKKLFGMMFYLSFKEEREGFANGLYAYLMDFKDYLAWENIDGYIKKEESYIYLKNIQYLKQIMDNNRFSMQEKIWINDILKDTKKGWNAIVKVTNYTLKDYQRRLENIKKLVTKQLHLNEGLYTTQYSEDYIDRILELTEKYNCILVHD